MDLFHDHPRIDSDNYRLRAPLESEIDALYPLGLAYWEGKEATTLDAARVSLRKTAEEYKAGNALHWLIESKADEKIVGFIGFYRGFKELRGEIGYVMSPAFRGKKIMTEILPRVMDFAFKVKGLSKIIAITQEDNPASVNLLNRFGFRLETKLDDGRLQFGRGPR